MTLYKFLAEGATGAFSGYRWSAPEGTRSPGAWVVAGGALDPCRGGLHVCRPEDLPFWLLEELYTVEVDAPVLEYDSFVLARRARLLRRVDAWDRELAGTFSRTCAWRVRDLAAEVLRMSDRVSEADRLSECDTMQELLEVSEGAAGRDGWSGALVGYAADAARFAAAAGSEPRWPAHAATVGLVAATAARVGAGEDAVAAERARQGEWLSGHLLAAV